MSFAPLRGFEGASPASLPTLSDGKMSGEKISDLQLRFMDAPLGVPSPLWRLSSVDERRALVEQADARIQLADASGGRVQFQTPASPGQMQTIAPDVVAKALDAGERSVGMKGVSLKDAAQAFLRGAPAKAAGIAGALLIPSNRTEPFTYQFAPDLRGRQGIGVTTINFERRVNGEWQPLRARAEIAMEGGIRVDTKMLEREYGKPLPTGLAPSSVTTDQKASKLCKEIGAWVPDTGYAGREATQANANRYQDYISGRVAQQFRVAEPMRASGQIDFDGCKDTPGGPVLLEAKGDHRNTNIGESWYRGNVSLVKQAEEQSFTATRVGARLEWHAQTVADTNALNKLFERNPLITVSVQNTPMMEKR
jgi:Restriction endonuclease fold toxin 5